MSEAGLLRGPPAYRPSSPWRPGAALAAFAAIVGLMQGLAYLGPVLMPGVMDGGMAAEMRAMAVAQAVGVVLVLAASGLRGGRPTQVLALHRPAASWRAYAAGAAATLLWPLVTVIPLAIVAALLGVDTTGDWDLQETFQQGASLSLQVAVLVIGAPIAEELICRGFLLSALAQTRLGFWGAAVVVTGLWTVLHPYSAFGLAKVFLAGLLLSWILRRTGSLRVTIACHALNNALALLMQHLIELLAEVNLALAGIALP